MGSFIVSGFALAGLGQAWRYGSRSLWYTKYAYELDFQGRRLDVLAFIREEVRDQVFAIVQSLDNLMVVCALMLNIGFGFVTEGTFPPSSAEHLDNFNVLPGVGCDPLVVYAFFTSLSLAFPFWSIILLFKMRMDVHNLVRLHMNELKEQLRLLMEQKEVPDPSMSRCGVIGADGSRKSAISFPDLERKQILKWINSDFLDALGKHKRNLKWIHRCYSFGLCSAILTSAILMGLYMQQIYPQTQLMWGLYAVLVGSNGLFGVLFYWSQRDHELPAGFFEGPKRKGRTTRPKGTSLRQPLLDGACFPVAQLRRGLQPSPQECITYKFRVQDASSTSRRVFREVRISPDPSLGLTFPVLEKSICDKFRRGNADGLQMTVLVRSRDRVQIFDDDDVSTLASGEKLEAVFARD